MMLLKLKDGLTSARKSNRLQLLKLILSKLAAIFVHLCSRLISNSAPLTVHRRNQTLSLFLSLTHFLCCQVNHIQTHPAVLFLSLSLLPKRFQVFSFKRMLLSGWMSGKLSVCFRFLLCMMQVPR